MTKTLQVPFECPECDRAYRVDLDLLKMTRLKRVAICGRCKNPFSLLVRLTDGRHTIPPVAMSSTESSPEAPDIVPVSNPLPEIPDIAPRGNPPPEIPDIAPRGNPPREIPDVAPQGKPLPEIPDIVAVSMAPPDSEPAPQEPRPPSRPMELVVETSSTAKASKRGKRGKKMKRRRYATDVGIGPKLKLLQEEYGLKVSDD